MTQWSKRHLLGLIADICEAKADHIESSYDDKETARAWRKAATKIVNTSNQVDV